MSSTNSEIYDLLGIGFGPANLSLAISLIENAEAAKQLPRIHFLERQPHFAWHPTLLLPGASLQVSPLKDLATMRDPTSSFSFTNYLHQTNRLVSFINKENQVPSRREWSAYLAWAGRRMDDYVTYDQEVISIEPVQQADDSTPVGSYDSARLLKIRSRHGKTGEVVERFARNITIAVGGMASIPSQVAPIYPSNPWTEDSPVIHSSTFLPSLAKIDAMLKSRAEQRLKAAPTSSSSADGSHPLRLAVLGSGQSAAEMAMHLYNTYPQARVTMVFRASAIVPSDDSAFVNAAAFDPERTDSFWKASEQQRSEWRKEFRRTNYSVVRPNVLNEIHTIVYDQTIELPAPFPGAAGPTQGHMEIKANTNVISVERVAGPLGDEIELSLSDNKVTGKTGVERFDAIFLGTGFNRSPKQLAFLRPLAKFFPALDPQSTLQTAMSGTSTPERLSDGSDAGEGAGEGDDEEAAERMRERQRGIARDYRLVSYADAAFAGRRRPSASASTFSRRGSDDVDSPPSASSRSSSVGALSLVSSTSTLNNPNASAGAGGAGISSGATPNVYLMGCNEATHGLSDSLLSIVAWRAGEITQSLLQHASSSSSLSHSAASTSVSSPTGVLSGKGGDALPAVLEGDKEGVQPQPQPQPLLKQATLKANETLHKVTDQLQRLQSSVTVQRA
ncbi:hypothetical protein OC842_001959 [Tilletia horrida]|uniref:L-ornithine N(5)-monooxygenase [NAD(P)H] n=1 Tax=Tilletia horrida TaxID=155126 RepID=A0AAN6JM27_9BASI|nr:hypothetical protein OC842_001959 [Tilletia horrida]KAK0564813.1 hypothetical protein OC844_001524 [Tilletia horrida]